MICDFNFEISYICPACGNYFYGSCVSSYNTVGASFLSDGSMINCYDPFWLTRCPKCNQFFAKEYLFRLPKSISIFPTENNLSYWAKKELENNEHFGRVDGYFGDDEPKVKFIENAIAQGLYFPVLVSEHRKKELNIQLYKDLWWEYNRKRSAQSNDTYTELCYKLISMISPKNDEDRLTLAELYRNVGDFEKCLATLEIIVQSKKYDAFIECIRAEALQKNTNTVKIIPEKATPWLV